MAIDGTDLENEYHFFQIITYAWIKGSVFKVSYTTAKINGEVECPSINIIVHGRIKGIVLKDYLKKLF